MTPPTKCPGLRAAQERRHGVHADSHPAGIELGQETGRRQGQDRPAGAPQQLASGVAEVHAHGVTAAPVMPARAVMDAPKAKMRIRAPPLPAVAQPFAACASFRFRHDEYTSSSAGFCPRAAAEPAR